MFKFFIIPITISTVINCNQMRGNTQVSQDTTLPEIDFTKRLDLSLEKLNGSSMLLFSQPESYRNATVENIYRQDSNFYYLTGIQEPHAALGIFSHGEKGKRTILFVRDKNFQEELWTGLRLGIEGARNFIAVDEVKNIDSLWQELPGSLNGTKNVYYELGYDAARDAKLIAMLNLQKKSAGRKQNGRLAVLDPNVICGTLRLKKSPAEILRMKKGAEISAETYAEVFRSVRPGMSERFVYGMLMGGFIQRGAEMEAYGSIVAGGANACVLHYRDNNKVLNNGDLLLIDAGAQFELYATDITRTFPVGKNFSAEQKVIYELVLAAQKAAIELAKPGSDLVKIHDRAVEVLVDGLMELKFFPNVSKLEVLEKQLFKKFYPHGTSHWLGLDVHDQGEYYRDEKPSLLEAGNVFTVEPGIYIDPSYQDVDARWRGIGVRIEDDILITEAGSEVLTKDTPKELKDFENRF